MREIVEEEENKNNNNPSREERMIEYEERQNLVKVFKDLEEVLNEDEKNKKSINEVYENYVEYKFITKSQKQKVGDFLLKFMFFFEGPFFGIIYLIGIFQMKSIMKALFDLLKESFVNYYNCEFKSNCNITITENETSVYNFYEYYYSYTMNETVDFNLMLLTGVICTFNLELVGFKMSTFILAIINLASIIWLSNFNFSFKSPGIFDYNFFKLLNICFIYILLYIAIGGSAILSHQILVESYLKYKKYLIEKKTWKKKWNWITRI